AWQRREMDKIKERIQSLEER
ncbi:TPA: tail fiber domain-containing protein, partial [Escherichia coli]|nr:tail fiber domain-containing protein [Escherichia coli]HAG9086741.1 tail fiber domain-containing protein [Escherichia coli]